MSSAELVESFNSFEVEYTKLYGGFSLKDKFKSSKFDALSKAKGIINSIKSGSFSLVHVLELFKSIGLWPFFEQFTTMFVKLTIDDALHNEQYKQVFDKALNTLSQFKQQHSKEWSLLVKHFNDLYKYNDAGIYAVALLLSTCSDMLTATLLKVIDINLFYNKFITAIPEQYKSITEVIMNMIVKAALATQQQTIDPNANAKDSLFRLIDAFVKDSLNVNKLLMSFTGIDDTSSSNIYEYMLKQPQEELKCIAIKVDPCGFILPFSAFIMHDVLNRVNNGKLKGGLNIVESYKFKFIMAICVIVILSIIIVFIYEETKYDENGNYRWGNFGRVV